jgi:hypothetical protein
MPEPTVHIVRADIPKESDRWTKAWKTWPMREVFAHPGYVALFAGGEEIPAAALADVNGVTVLYPFIIRPLRTETFWEPSCGDCVDLVSPYGYGGAYWWGERDRSAVARTFWRHFDSWASDANVVSEFIRFDLHPDRLAPYPGNVDTRLMNVVRSLQLSPQQLWMDMAHKVRKNVKRARSSGLRVLRDGSGALLEDFVRIYRNTMSRRGANKRYLFPLEWFRRLVDGLTGQFVFFHALKDDRVVSSELVLVSSDIVYSYLGGTDTEASRDRPNDLLKFEIMLWAQEEGKREFVLGGGHQPEDGIFRYKRSFAPRGLTPFSIGTRILDPERYARLCRRASQDRGVNVADPKYFPAYRS